MEALNKILIIKGILAERAGLDPQLYSEISAHFDELKQLFYKGCVVRCADIEAKKLELTPEMIQMLKDTEKEQDRILACKNVDWDAMSRMYITI